MVPYATILVQMRRLTLWHTMSLRIVSVSIIRVKSRSHSYALGQGLNHKLRSPSHLIIRIRSRSHLTLPIRFRSQSYALGPGLSSSYALGPTNIPASPLRISVYFPLIFCPFTLKMIAGRNLHCIQSSPVITTLVYATPHL